MKSLLHKNGVEMYLPRNEGKSIVAQRLIRTLKNQIYKYMTLVSKNIYIDKLDDTVNKYNTYQSTIKMKPVDVKSNTYIDSIKENKIRDIVRISKYKNAFAKCHILNSSEDIFVNKKVKSTVPWTYVSKDFNGEGRSNCRNFLRKKVAKNKSKRI